MHDIECLKRSNPRAFWRYFKSTGNRVSNSVSLEDFKDFFANLSDGYVNMTRQKNFVVHIILTLIIVHFLN